MDRETRNILERTTHQARSLLEKEYSGQLDAKFDILADGTIQPDAGQHLVEAEDRFLRARLVATIEHRRAQGESPTESVGNLSRECAFTFLNRFVALRMLEARGLIKPSVSKGEASSGFTNEFLLLAPGLKALPDKGYRLYIESLFDEIGREVGVLFDQRDIAGQLWPDRPTLTELLELLSNPALESVWAADETIGWVYQYFNNDEERRQMRAASAAPRNSREMAVRNQFFTPRYVVEFLTDNTLGRTWYEMCQGQTLLKSRCHYLVRRLNEKFAQPGDQSIDAGARRERTQEDLVGETASIPYRAPKDPRAMRVLDPACGSGHFLLYCFDLFEVIYDEAWEAGIGTLRQEYPKKDALKRSVPELILHHNLFGIDIDPRAAQIGSLAIWMRAQRAWDGLPRTERPVIRRANIVVAEPMPGEADLLDEFCQGLEPTILGQFVRNVFERMKIAGDAGSLLRVDAEISSMVEEAKREWLADEVPIDRQGNPLLFASSAQRTIFEMERVTADFWQYAEERIFDALRHFAAAAENNQQFRRQLFADDAERGFAFIDVCRNRFDVILMNPPFGDRPSVCGEYLLRTYPETSADIYSMFFERTLGWLSDRGKVGAISNRTWLGLPSLEGLRKDIFGQLGSIECAADLGSFVLEAQVETAAVVVGKSTPSAYPAVWVRLLKTKAKEAALRDALTELAEGSRHRGVYISPQTRYCTMPSSVFGYWMSDRLIGAYRPENSIETRAATIKVGTQTGDDFRFLRLAWEVPATDIGIDHIWWRLAKGGEYSPFYDDVHLLLNWDSAGRELGAWAKAFIRNPQYFGRFGVTWPRRTTSAFSPRALPAGCAFGDKGPAAFPHNGVSAALVLGVLASRPSRLLLSARLGAGDDAPGSASKSYEVGLIRDLPFPVLEREDSDSLHEASATCSRLAQEAIACGDESSSLFLHPFVEVKSPKLPSLKGLAALAVESREDRLIESADLMVRMDRIVSTALGFTEEDMAVLEEELESPLASLPGCHAVDPNLFSLAYLEKSAVPGESLPGGVEAEQDVRVLTRRKKQTASLRSEESICRLFEIPPRQFVGMRKSLGLRRAEDLENVARQVVGYAVGCAMGRFDIQAATSLRVLASVSPFSALPASPPGLLKECPSQILEESDAPYAASDGILPHEMHAAGTRAISGGLLSLVENALQLLWKEDAPSVEREICDALGVDDIGEYLRQPAGFFQYHLRTYSKSRRQAPLYWPLSVASGKYSVWLYCPRLNRDTLWRVLNDFAKPRLAQEERVLAGLRSEAGDAPTPSQRRAIQDAESFVGELAEFSADIESIAPLWSPDLNDGVVLNFAVLWKVAPRLPTWQRELQDQWQKLKNGDYDWARIAMHLWPERVVPKCATDRSLAIAHGLEEEFWEEQPDGKWTAKRRSVTDVTALIDARSSNVVKAALDRILSRTAGPSTGRRARGSARRNP
ncbi:MAG: BREX-1 system adenine-specific DNA-methyltransferase PglX [Bradyrhizobium sp.]|nr:BREX-1 system adenine-specific DNA-methyltransferase PglX [Bradyrhizobium sp.]